MIAAIGDTHAIIWYLSGDSRLSIQARQFIQTALATDNEIGISSISLIEMVYLIEKGRISPQDFSQLANALSNPASMFVEIPVDLSIARALSRVDILQVPDMPDRIIAATAVHHRVPIISRDGKIRLSGIQTIW